ncbi:DUF881 domain-containing protein [Modestobacter sp. NPDC049651]|uniref:DUF881 domain-containing protein n=1 Tax=unclassified Modestobacter TaxID=2643866 RepID=UPI00340F0C79
MTTVPPTVDPPPRRPRTQQRSLGASLLDQVLAETLDPSYAQAAARKREAAAQQPEGARPPGSWLARHRGQLLVAATLLIAGLLVAVTYREAAAGAQGREQRREALVEDIQAESATTDQLADQVAELNRQVTRQRDEALAASAVGQRALEQLSAAEQATALTAVRGPGLEVVVGNADPASDTDPVGGSESVALAGLVQDRDLQQVVNALWASGAEAVSINGQRLGATTTIRQAGSAILVDFRPLTSPYRVQAIGDQETLYNRFLVSPGARYVADLSKRYGLKFTVGRDKDLSLPAGSAPELRSARPLEEPQPAPGAPTDPTPGG